jgi:hypothetical protein
MLRCRVFARGWALGVIVVLAGCVDLTPPSGLHSDAASPGLHSDAAAPIAGKGEGGQAGTGGAGDPVDADPAPTDGWGASDGGAPDAPLVVIGQPCDRDDQCSSGACAQGICCGGPCTAACQACNLTGALGTCTPVPAGEDPGGDCEQADVSTCGLDGTCDGAGACRKYAVGSECVAGSCASAVELSASTCDGAGTCRPGSSRSCAPGICMGPSCASTCAQSADCQTGFFCDVNHCAVKRAQGAACSAALQCMSGHCVDGFCCNNQCGETCRACNVAGAVGICTLVPKGMDPRAQCPAEAPSSCGRAGGCDGTGACRRHPLGTACAASSCANALNETSAGMCNGLGVCRPGGSRDCAPYLCAGTACVTTCTSSDVCAPGLRCTPPACGVDAGLALYWRFEETLGGLALDSSGNGLHGQYLGPPTASTMLPTLMYPNVFSRAFSTAARHAVRLASAPAALKPANNVSISLWYRATAVDDDGGPPVGAQLFSLGSNYQLRLRPDAVEVSKRTNGGSIQCKTATFGAVLDGNWHHVAAVLGSVEGVKLYFDGGLRGCLMGGASSNTSSIIYDLGTDLFVGRQATGEDQWDFGGNMDELRVYTRALSAAEVAVLAQGRN